MKILFPSIPRIDERRLFLWKGQLFSTPPVDPGDDFTEHLPEWEALAAQFPSPFMTMDVGRLEEGGWTVVEVGDGGVSGLSPDVAPVIFYAALRNLITSWSHSTEKNPGLGHFRIERERAHFLAGTSVSADQPSKTAHTGTGC